MAIAIVIIVAAYFLLSSPSPAGQASDIVRQLMGRLTSDQIRQVASVAGFTGNDLDTAVAIALAESSGNPNALGDLNLGVSVGLWQINLKFHPEYTKEELYDPQTNANAAFAIYEAAGEQFSPWSTFKSDAYLAYLPQTGEIGGVS